jgi:glucan phosphoethanolaminetransferase (alkaline phosphatase superfamily)
VASELRAALASAVMHIKKVAGVVFGAVFKAGVSSAILSKKSVLKQIKESQKNIMLSCIIIMIIIIQNRRSKLEFIANKKEKFENITNKIFTHAH